MSAPDNYDTLYVQRGAEEAFRIAVDDARNLRSRLNAAEKEVDRLQANEVVIADERFDMERRLNARIALLEKVVEAVKECAAGMTHPDGLELPPARGDWERVIATLAAYEKEAP